ncbi:TetR/AcrR family transcriptional regulator [Mycobacterium sp. SM3041]|uniref:TetR/AcrR family transcriptional regulator n=1 Tax=Mycobacterium sp. SM3041 TaxID=3114291 RepID=UPI003204CE8A
MAGVDVANQERTRAGRTLTERKAERRLALLNAALDVIGEGGTRAVTTKAVCDRAGLIPRYLYESFQSRDDLVVAAFDTAFERVATALLRGFAEAQSSDESTRLRAALGASLDAIAEEPGALRLFLDVATDPVLEDRSQSMQAMLVKTVWQPILNETTSPPSNPAAAEFLATAVTGAAVSVLTSWTTGALDMTRDELLDYAVRFAATMRASVA